MIKKFFVALIVGLLVMSSRLAVAEDYDWNQAKRIGTKAEFANYIESERRRGHTTFHLILTNNFRNGFRVDSKEDFANLAPCIDVNGNWHINNDGTAQMTYEIEEYSGTHVANAYLSGDKSKLTPEEEKLYEVAVGIVYDARKFSSTRDKVRYIHDAIHERVKNWETMDYADAKDALNYGKTDCEGFADAFYMLGRMAGLNVGRIRGTINNGETPHGWNWITLEDGRTYCVDVSQDWIDRKNGADKYKYFVVPSSTMQNNSYSCEWEIIPNLQRN